MAHLRCETLASGHWKGTACKEAVVEAVAAMATCQAKAGTSDP